MNNQNALSVSEEVAAALADSRPVVALESTIISHGMPYPQNVETAQLVEATVREHGAVPATIAIMDGKLCAGLYESQITTLGKTGQQALKVSRRDIPFAIADGSVMGATTVAATMIIAQMAGIRVFATGGIGGVHRGAEETFDISADLQELASTNVAVVCAGAKSILDIGLTREYLETQGVPVIGYQTDYWPAFYTRYSEFTVDYNLPTPQAVADVLRCKWQLGLDGGALVCVPVPEQYEQNADEIEQVIQSAIQEMNEKRITGKETTPFLLAKIAEMTSGESLDTNIRLVLNNATVAAQIAVSY
ncbi:MAG: pseudouridine-5'-phosphate glycosidase [Pseudomonadota bacterium]